MNTRRTLNTIHRSFLLALLCFIAVSGIAHAQQINSVTVQNVNGTPAGTFAIRNARIFTVSGDEIENGTILIRDGRIEAVGARVNVPGNAQTIDARGLNVYPGMIDLGTSMGLVEIAAGAPGTVDLAEVGDLNPNSRAHVAISPHSAHIGVTRFVGVTSVLSLPLGGLISGQAAFINLNGSTPKEMTVIPEAALVINFPRVSDLGGEFSWARPAAPANLTEATRARDERLERIRRLMRDAEAYGRAQDAYARDRNLPRPDRDVTLESLLPFVRGERPVILRADRAREIEAAVRFAEDLKLKPIIIGGAEAAQAANFLREHNVPVIFTAMWDLPYREDDAYDTFFETPAKLQRAGVRFCISTGNTGASVRDLPFHAGMSAAYGLPRAEALRAVTLYPAQIMNVANQMGTIEPGKTANIVITDGDLLDARTNVRHLFIAGRQIPLTSRHTELYEAFRNRK